MPKPRKKIQASLKLKGFREDEKTKHRYYHFIYKGKVNGVNTFVSRDTKYKEFGDSLLSRMWKQLHLNSKQELLDLVDCPMDQEQLIDLLRTNGILPIE